MGRVQTARHDGLIRRLFSIKGGGSLLAETLGDAFPVIPLEGGPIELLKLAGWDLGLVGGTFTSPVGQTAGWQLVNPVNSGKIMVPTTAFFANNASNTVFMGVTDDLFATATVGRQRDTREGVLAETAGQGRNGNAPGAPVGAIRLLPQVSIQVVITDNDGLAVLAPGTAFTLVTISTNVDVRWGFFWRERVAEPSELNF